MSEMTPESQRPLVENLSAHLAGEIIETHISSVILAGDRAYKIKKPLDLGFLDFSTLEKRRHYCREELRLNARLAASLYVDVVPVGGTPEAPELGAEPAIEYAIEMRRFPQSAQLDRKLDTAGLAPETMDRIADRVAGFHQDAAPADPDSPFGTPETVLSPVQQNFAQLRELTDDRAILEGVERVERWSLAAHERLAPRIAARKREGHVRECHGDMHLANIAEVEGEILIFDGIEFNADLRWIDTINDLAFLVMDLDHRGLEGLGRRLLDRYLEHTGDYAGVRLLDFYCAYRAMVRAKVGAFRLAQPGLEAEEKAAILADCRAYVELAQRYTRPGDRFLAITHGVSGAGKTTLARPLVEATGALQLRSDVERTRLFGERDPGETGLGQGKYAPGATEQTYSHLAELAGEVLQAGRPVILDATFLQQKHRRMVQDLAETLDIPFVIVDVDCPRETLQARIRRRQSAGSDASEADIEVMESQRETREPLTEWEARHAVRLDCEADPDRVVEAFRAHLARS